MKSKKQLLLLSEEIGKVMQNIQLQIKLLDKLMWLLIYNSGKSYEKGKVDKK